MSWDAEARAGMVGRTIESIALDQARERITVKFSDGSRAIGATTGDCCSQTWVEHLTVPPDVRGATVTGIKGDDYDSRTPATPSENVPEGVYLDEVVAYQQSIQTTKGEIVIEFRNSSNGYYGGTLDWSLNEAVAA